MKNPAGLNSLRAWPHPSTVSNILQRLTAFCRCCLRPAFVAAVLIVATASCTFEAGSNDAEVQRGQSLYAENCQVCHGDAATGEGGIVNAPVHGPDGHTWHHADGQLTDIILGRLNFPGRTMPSFEGTLSEEDVYAILAFFKSNWESDQLAFQAEVSMNWETLQRNRQQP